MNILVVDDDAKMVESIRIGLQCSGYGVYEALNGQQALERLSQDDCQIDVVVTDYLMSAMNGVDLLKAIRRQDPCLPVIMMTGYAETSTIIEAIQNNCSGFIEKPFRLDQLIAEIGRVTPHIFPQAEDSSLVRLLHSY